MLILNPSLSIEKNASNVTAASENEPGVPPNPSELNSGAAIVMIEVGEVVKKKRGRKPGSISKKKLIAGKIGKKLGKKRGRKPKHIKEKLLRQAALLKLKQ